MRLLTFLLTFFFVGSVFCAPQYEKVSPTQIKEIDQVTQEKTYSIKDLLNEKVSIIGEIETVKQDYKNRIAKLQERLKKIETLIEKAKELGVSETGDTSVVNNAN